MTQWKLLAAGLVGFAATGALAQPPESGLPDCETNEREVEFLSRTQPYYPHSAQMFCLTGRVEASFTIDRQGLPKEIRILESEPEGVFDRSTVDTIEQWRFIPACRDGAPAEREVTQTVEFRLPDASEASCAAISEKLEGRTPDLLADIGARYALLFDYLRTGEGRSRLQVAVEQPFDDFEGDLARVADFHRRALERIVQRMPNRGFEASMGDTVVALMPVSLRDDPELAKARALFARTRESFEQRRESARELHQWLSSAYRQLERNTRLDSETLALLVEPFLGDPQRPFEETLRPESRSLDKLEALLTFLESNADGWRFVDGELRFDERRDQEVWQSRWEDFLRHREKIETAALEVMRSFQDYSD